MSTPEAWSLAIQATGIAIPLGLAVAAVGWPRRAALATGLGLGLALLFTAGAALTPTLGAGAGEHAGTPFALGVGMDLGVRVDAVTCVMLLMVGALGVVIVRYSGTYLHGDPGLARYLRWLLFTLSAVTALLVANNLLVIALSWTAAGVALHQLLTFYPDRTAARVAAHKKFLVSRLADASLLACLPLIHANVGSLNLDRIAAWATAHPELTPSMHTAAALVVGAVALKSAQIPFHGWLTQVMEAPTPVSALLHAGVVNIGGFVLIRLAPWMAHAEFAQLLLVAIGVVSATIAALVMTTRISVKVALAWSTCAQMGFMLIECGLGLWHLALLHLVGHSLYKAHAFLISGTTVDAWRVGSLSERPLRPSWGRVTAGTVVAVGTAMLGLVVLERTFAGEPGRDLSVPVLALLVSLSTVPLLVRGPASVTGYAAVALRVLGVILLYVGGHAAAAQLMPVHGQGPSTAGLALVAAAFVGLFVVKTMLEVSPEGRPARTLYPWLFAGLYLDEFFTRLTFRLWPPQLEARPAPTRKTPAQTLLEARS